MRAVGIDGRALPAPSRIYNSRGLDLVGATARRARPTGWPGIAMPLASIHPGVSVQQRRRLQRHHPSGVGSPADSVRQTLQQRAPVTQSVSKGNRSEWMEPGPLRNPFYDPHPSIPSIPIPPHPSPGWNGAVSILPAYL